MLLSWFTLKVSSYGLGIISNYIIYFILIFSRTWWFAIRVKGCPCTKPVQNCSLSFSLFYFSHALIHYILQIRRDRTMPIYGRRCPTECCDVTAVSRAKVSPWVLIIPGCTAEIFFYLYYKLISTAMYLK